MISKNRNSYTKWSTGITQSHLLAVSGLLHVEYVELKLKKADNISWRVSASSMLVKQKTSPKSDSMVTDPQWLMLPSPFPSPPGYRHSLDSLPPFFSTPPRLCPSAVYSIPASLNPPFVHSQFISVPLLWPCKCIRYNPSFVHKSSFTLLFCVLPTH